MSEAESIGRAARRKQAEARLTRSRSARDFAGAAHAAHLGAQTPAARSDVLPNFADEFKGNTVGDIKSGEPFGLDIKYIDQIDWSLSVKRISHDVRSDFIYAPHLNFIYSRAGDEIIQILKAELKAGAYSPGVPITIEVPKSYRISVAAQIKRLGPPFSRPGSILLPKDRLFYQALADMAAPLIKLKTDESRSFSHRLDLSPSGNMFVPTRTCWNDLQKALKILSEDKTLLYVVKLDVANFFGALNQHELINVLSDSGYPKPLNSRLEALITSFTGNRSSRGMLQGMYPSDLFGNFYLAPIDKILEEHGVASARYVDDVYVFVQTMRAAERVLRELISSLRTYDLTLNEAKSRILLKSSLITEEPDLEALFANAVEEVAEQIDDDDFDVDYGFQSEWDEIEDEHEKEGNEKEEGQDDQKGKLELEATKILFSSIDEYDGHEESIERYCLPLFAKANSDFAVEHVIDAFKKRPAMSQIYVAYLAKFLADEHVSKFLIGLLSDTSLLDWQALWVVAALSQVIEADDAYIKVVLDILKDGDRHETLRAAAAVYVGRFGNHHRRKTIAQIYASTSSYIQSAIYFSSRNWPGVERTNAKAAWGNHHALNILISAALAKK